jgi:hypothetical protein
MHQTVSNRPRLERRATPRTVRTKRLSLSLGLLMALATACDGSATDPAANLEAGGTAGESVDPIVSAPPAAPLADPLEGTWWILSSDLPYMGLRAEIVAPTADDNSLDGSWVSFDWRGSADAASLLRLSKPVAIRATRDGDTLQIEGAAPMLGANGNPNGHRGHWSLTLRRASLLGEALRYSGRSHHGSLTDPGGTPVVLVRDFQAWQK